VIDLHVTVALQNLLAEYEADPALFSDLFWGFPQAVFDGWHAALFPGEPAAGKIDRRIEVGLAFRPNRSRIPFVAVRLLEQPSEQEAFGHVTGVSDGEETDGQFIRQILELTCFVDDPELLRVLHVVVRKALLRLSNWTLENGYSGLSFRGGGDLDHVPELEQELEGGIERRVQTWSTILSDEVVGRQYAVTDPIAVAADDTVIDEAGNLGGVTALEE